MDTQGVPKDTVAKYLGCAVGNEPGAQRAVVCLDDGREITVGLLAIDLAVEFVMDAQTWHSDIPRPTTGGTSRLSTRPW